MSEPLETVMGSLNVRRSANPEFPVLSAYRPLQSLRDFFGWDPFQEMSPLVPTSKELPLVPPFEVRETKEMFIFKADVPGIEPQNLEVNVIGNRLTISGERAMATDQKLETNTYYTHEQSYGQFSRSFTLPEGTDVTAVHAELKWGVLTVILPKLPQVQAKKIAIDVGRLPRS
jgi:HSP20 family protein